MLGTRLTSTAFRPRFGLNPPQRLPILRNAVSISFEDSRLVAVDRQDQVWSYYRGESDCDAPAPIKALDAAMVAKQHLTLCVPAHLAHSSTSGECRA
ncbi:hypothetical protein ASG87_05770 [Frateuria sp. Soil773]|uniref:hypothetical protein n=1 Tax=Frateuria sp. Soil773 TaxID=1736407 RepID=UPI0006F9EC16|nr:hypothetical protein [Frateuria sp. Soil773]KRE89051.1 hypothetical protein ASG87_05770 [Frateuria sp. Soil773]